MSRARVPPIQNLPLRSAPALPGATNQVAYPSVSARNACTMSPEERLAEVSALLAAAFVRHSSRRSGISSLKSPACVVNSAESSGSRDTGGRRQRKESA